ncbi:hypothetical protein MNB_SV-12-1005 [hydrothermal vent metagenome]|uniref:Transposase IS200-like domain-containing protein n=1 Tax=hydrothermal vent metagenome TaxID=652676 RepID=A0A1W1BD16_9ZZZZ
MGREKRVTKAGYHYIFNHGVEFRNIFIVRDDYLAFISILSNLSYSHEFSVQSYSLVPHSYYILIKTRKDNLSNIMKLQNGKYSRYFNSKYGRSGYLWEGRYKSCFIENKNYLFYFIRYIEQLPKLLRVSSKIDSYQYSSYRQFIGLDTLQPYLRESIIFQQFNTLLEIKEFFSISVKVEEIENIYYILQKRFIENSIKEKRSSKISSYFNSLQSKEEEDKAILKAYQDGFSQSKISKEIGISQQAVSKRIRQFLG